MDFTPVVQGAYPWFSHAKGLAACIVTAGGNGKMEGSSHKPAVDGSQVLANRIADICLAVWPDRPGIYVEAGANDGVQWSSTSPLEKSGWTGVLVEPSPAAYSILRQKRPRNVCVNVALVGDSSMCEVEGTFTTGSLMGSAHPTLRHRDAGQARRLSIEYWRRRMGLTPHVATTRVPAKTLDAVLHEHSITEVDLLVLDVEGFELSALKGLEIRRPTILVIETRDTDALAISELLLARGYVLCGNLSHFNPTDHPSWSGDHQDLCWCLASNTQALQTILSFIEQ